MISEIPYILEGEIVSVQASPKADKKNLVRYSVRVDLPNGSQVLLPNVVASTLFGGIDDYFQERARSSVDSGQKFKPTTNDANNDARIGQRVYVSFVGGSITKPVIICYAQHPNQTVEFESPEGLEPQAVLKYLGMRFDFKKDGVFRVTHYGAPKIKYVDSATTKKGAAAVGAVTDILGAASENPIEPDKTNPAVEPADATKRTFVEFKDTGGLEIRDSLNQLVHVDTEKGRIYIANNDSQGGPQIATNSTDSEYVLLERKRGLVLINARKIAQIYSFDRRKDVTDGNHSHKVGGDEEITVFGDKTDKIEGDVTETVGGDYRQDVSGAYTVSSLDAFSFDTQSTYNISAKQDVEIATLGGAVTVKSAGATLKLDAAAVALGVGGVEILKTLSDAIQGQIDTLTALQAATFPTSMGPTGPAINIADFIKVMTTLTTLKAALDAITGSL